MQLSSELTADDTTGIKLVRRITDQEIVVEENSYTEGLALCPTFVSPWDWQSRHEQAFVLSWQDLPEWVSTHLPHLEILLIGLSNDEVPKKHRLFQPQLQVACAEKRIGLEVMNTLSAARTYNILAGDGRQVLALLWP